MALPTIIASNQTGSPKVLTRLGLTVPASTTLELTLYAFVDEIRQDDTLQAFVEAGDIFLNYGNGDLTQGDSLKFFSIVTSEVKIPVRLLSDSNVAALSGTPSIDTTGTVVNDRVLLTAQTAPAENGIWVVKAGAWARPEDFDTDQSASSVIVEVQEGATYGNQTWHCTNNKGAGVIDTDGLSFAVMAGGGGGVTNLQTAYEGGNTITVTSAEGPLAVTLTSDDFTVNGANDVLFGNATPLATFNVDAGLMSLDSTDTTNLTMTASDGANKTLTIAASNAGAGDGLIAVTADGTIDIDGAGGVSLNSTGGALNIGDDANTGAINVGTGASVRTITVGNATGATALDINSGTGGTLIDSTGVISLDAVGASNFTTDSGDLTFSTTTSGAVNVSSIGAVDVQAAGAVTIDSSGSTIGIGTDSDDGAINVGTGTTAGRIVTVGNTTGTTALNLNAGTGNVLVTAPNTTFTGNIVVQGTTTTSQSEIVNIADSFLYLNDGYETTGSPLAGGIAINVDPQAANDTVDVGGFTAGVAATSNPTVETFTGTVFAAGDLIQIRGADNQTNDGLYEVDDHTGTTLTIRGVGTVGTTYGYTQNDFVTDTTVAGTIRKVKVGVLQSSTTGAPQWFFGGDTTNTFTNIVTSSTGTTLSLQSAYDGGNTATTAGAVNFIVAGTEALQITTTLGLDVDTIADFDVSTFDVLMSGNNGFSIDGTASSNLNVVNTVAATSTVLTIGAANTGITSGDATVDINATSTNGSGVITLDADDTISLDVLSGGSIGIGTDGVTSTTTIGNNTGTTGVTVNSGTEQVEIDGVTYYGANTGIPTATTSGFQDGDKFYDTDLDSEMRYDATRAKWLSVQVMHIQIGRNQNTPADVYYRGIDGRVMSSTLGYLMPYNGTVVGFGYTRSDVDAATFEIVEGGTARAELASSATAGKSNALDGDFSADGILAVRNKTGSNTVSDVMAWVAVKWRSV